MAEGFTYSSADVANALAQVTGGTSLDQWRQRLNLGELERSHGLPTGTLSAVMRHESNGDPYATSKKGAKGLFQFMDATAKGYNIDPFDPEQAAPAAAKELGSLYKKYGGDVDKTLAAWNWGQGNFDKQGIDNAPTETKGFMAKVGGMLSPSSAEAAERAPQRAASAQQRSFTYTPDDVSAIMQQLGGGTAKSASPSAPMQTERSLNPWRDPSAVTIDIEKESPDAKKQLPPSLVQLTPEMDDDEILERLGYDPAEVKKSRFYKPGMYQKQVPAADRLTAGLEDSPLGGFGRGVQDFGEGVAQTITRGLGKVGILGPAEMAQADALTKLHEAVYQQNVRHGAKVDPTTGEATGMFADPSRMLGQGVATAGIPAGGPTTLARTVWRGALMGSGLAAAQPVLTTDARPGGERDTFWEQKASQIGTGALFGGVLSPALEKGIVPAITKGANWARGRGVSPEMQRRVDLEQRFGVRLGYQDVVPGRIPGQVSQALENVPGTGFGGFRIGQHEDTRRAIARYQDELQTALRGTPWRDLPAVQAAAARGGRIGAEASALLDEIRAVGNDPHRTIQASSKLNLFQDRLQSERNYSKVDRLAKPLGNMRPTQTVQRIDDMIAQYNRDPLPSAEVKREVLGALSRAKGELTPSRVTHPTTGIASSTIPDTSYSTMRQLRSSLGTIQREAATAPVARAIGEVKSALENDMRDFALKSGNPALVRAQQVADRFHYNRVIRYRGQALAKAAEKDLPDEIYNKFGRQGRDRAQYFYRGLDPKGQAAVRAGMVDEAYQKATVNRQPGVFDAGVFASEMQRHQRAANVFFRGQDRDYLNGFTEVMQLARRGGEYVDKPPSAATRAIVGVGGLGVGAFGGLPLLAKIAATSQGLRALWLTQAGRNFLLTSSRVGPASPRWQRAMQRFAREAGRTGGLAGAELDEQSAMQAQRQERELAE